MRTTFAVKGETLASVKLFGSLPLAVRDRIASFCRGYFCGPGDTIVAAGDDGTDVYFVLTGAAQVRLQCSNGRCIIYNERGPGETVGELAAIDRLPRSAEVVAKEECRVAVMGASNFNAVLNQHPEVLRNLLCYLANQVRDLSNRIYERTALSVDERVAAELLRYVQESKDSNRYGTISPIPPHAEIASRAGTHREAVTRRLNDLARTGLLEKSRNAIVIRDVAQLSEIAKQ